MGDWLDTAEPDVILLIIGTNDIAQGHNLDTAPDRLKGLIDELFHHRPQAQIFVGSIPPIDEPGLNARVVAYNQANRPTDPGSSSPGRAAHLCRPLQRPNP